MSRTPFEATRSAVEEGIVAGGGKTLINAQKAVKAVAEKLEGDEKIGAKIICKAIEDPMKMIAYNAGLEGSVIVEKAKTEKENIGFDASKLEWVDMIKVGIIDPAKVVRSALQNAASVAGMLCTTEVLITDKAGRETADDASGRRHGRHGRHVLRFCRCLNDIRQETDGRGPDSRPFYLSPLTFLALEGECAALRSRKTYRRIPQKK